MSCTSPKTVASTTVPLVAPSLRSRNCSRCATAFFITSADCSTNGRISSPRPNRSPTSFIAGNRISLSTSTGVRSLQGLVDLRFDAVLAPAQNRLMDALFDRRFIAARSLRSCRSTSSLGDALSKCSMKRASASGPPIEHEIVAQLAHVGVDLEVRGDLLGVHERAIETGFDAVVEEDRVERGARRRLQAERNVRDAERRRARPAARA